MLQEYSAEYRAFQKHFGDLFESIQNPPTLSARLFSAELLTGDVRRTICSLEKPTQQLTELLDAVEGQIKVDLHNFYKFVEALEKDAPMQHLCDKLRDTCGEKNECLVSARVKLTSNTCLCCYCSTTQNRDTSGSVTIS